jgi:DNA-binding transcriptional regulator of glucitol operon
VIFAILAALIVLAALGWLGRVILRTWRQVRAFGRVVTAASDRLAEASAGLDAAGTNQGSSDRRARADW